MTILEAAEVIATMIRTAELDAELGYGIEQLSPRVTEFASPMAMKLIGLAAVPRTRELLDTCLDARWAESTVDSYVDTDEVVIGDGLHAAIYCTGRVKRGFPKPVVLGRGGRVGGTFAWSCRPSFYLNSRNRPGRLGLPGEGGALNYIPGSIIQPADLSMSEFQTNADFAYVIRLLLALNARVATGADVERVDLAPAGPRSFNIPLDDGALVACDRVIDARGCGDPVGGDFIDGAAVMTFPQFIARMDQPFPLRGMMRVAVIGSGDSARSTVAALLGIGPVGHLSSAALDFVESIDWYGPGVPSTCEEWRVNERALNARIGAFLPRPEVAQSRVKVFDEYGEVSQALEGAYVNDRLYDAAILATGFELPSLRGVFSQYGRAPVGTTPFIAQQFGGFEAYAIGPAAEIPFSETEEASAIGRIRSNRVAAVRYAGRSAALAARLDAPSMN